MGEQRRAWERRGQDRTGEDRTGGEKGEKEREGQGRAGEDRAGQPLPRLKAHIALHGSGYTPAACKRSYVPVNGSILRAVYDGNAQK